MRDRIRDAIDLRTPGVADNANIHQLTFPMRKTQTAPRADCVQNRPRRLDFALSRANTGNRAARRSVYMTSGYDNLNAPRKGGQRLRARGGAPTPRAIFSYGLLSVNGK